MRFQSLVAVAVVLPFASAQLHQLAKEAGLMYFGTATDNGELNNTQYVKILTDTKEFGQLTPSNGMKWFAVEPFQNVFNFSMGSVVADLAKKNKQILRCHTLTWHSQLAPWVEFPKYPWTKANLTSALINHVTKEAAHWKGQCYAWDVLNEALNDDGTYRNSTFLQVIGPDYIKIAFRAAAKADPWAKLYYNDYGIERIGNKSNAVRKMVKWLQDDGVKIDGVGLQSHFTVGRSPTLDDQIANMKEYAKLDVDIAITELDVRVALPANTTNMALQSQVYENTTGACLQVEECLGITVWDFYDPFSWIPDVFPGFGDGTLYFANFTKHPAYNGIIKAFKNVTDHGDDDDDDDEEEEGHHHGGGWWKKHHWWRV